MKLVQFSQHGNAPQAGAWVGNEIISLAGAGFSNLLSLIQGGADALAAVRAHTQRISHGIPASEVRLHAPLSNPPKLIMIGLNYRDHAIESNMPIPTTPTVFSKFNSSIIGPGDAIVLPAASEKPDYEAEIAFIIGKRCKKASQDQWREYVFGYTCINDVSARDLQLATPQWLMGKTCDTFCPMGPAIVTADEISDPHNLGIRMTVSGEVLQNGSTKELIFGVGELIAYISQTLTLEPGDVISTGTPPGVGFARKPPRLLRAGDECIVWVEGIGELRNPVVAE